MITYNDTPVYIGTAGYKFDDWLGTFYPEQFPNEQMLKFYSRDKGIDFLELTFTFYNDPTEEITANIAENASDELAISVRLGKRFLKEPPLKEDASEFKNGLSPIYNRVKAYFADFYNGFTPSRANFDHILRLRDTFADKPFFVELANRGWARQKFQEELKENGVGVINADFPPSAGLAPYSVKAFNNMSYFRLYGKSPEWEGPQKRDLNYRYSIKQLEKFRKDIDIVASVSSSVFVSFCNSAMGSAAANAIDLRKMLAGG